MYPLSGCGVSCPHHQVPAQKKQTFCPSYYPRLTCDHRKCHGVLFACGVVEVILGRGRGTGEGALLKVVGKAEEGLKVTGSIKRGGDNCTRVGGFAKAAEMQAQSYQRTTTRILRAKDVGYGHRGLYIRPVSQTGSLPVPQCSTFTPTSQPSRASAIECLIPLVEAGEKGGSNHGSRPTSCACPKCNMRWKGHTPKTSPSLLPVLECQG